MDTSNDTLYNNCPHRTAKKFKEKLDMFLSRINGGLSYLCLQESSEESIMYLFEVLEQNLTELKGIAKDCLKSGAFDNY